LTLKHLLRLGSSTNIFQGARAYIACSENIGQIMLLSGIEDKY